MFPLAGVYHFAMRFAVAFLIAIPLFLLAQDAPPPGAPKGGAKGGPKNLKLLKPEEVRPAMAAFRVALGQPCTLCHVEGNFASDDNPKKETARMMIAMTREINAKFPSGGSDRVTCYTCHRGDQHPMTVAAPKPPAQ